MPPKDYLEIFHSTSQRIGNGEGRDYSGDNIPYGSNID